MAIGSVVVADDEFLNRDLLEEIFTRMDITVRTAKDGVHALRALEEQPADLLLSDIRMPGMGRAARQSAREVPRDAGGDDDRICIGGICDRMHAPGCLRLPHEAV